MVPAGVRTLRCRADLRGRTLREAGDALRAPDSTFCGRCFAEDKAKGRPAWKVVLGLESGTCDRFFPRKVALGASCPKRVSPAHRHLCLVQVQFGRQRKIGNARGDRVADLERSCVKSWDELTDSSPAGRFFVSPSGLNGGADLRPDAAAICGRWIATVSWVRR